MSGSLRLGRVLGITIELHFSWFIIFAVITLSLALSLYNDGRSIAMSVTFGILTSILLFASVLAHELSHSVVAIRSGIPVKSITLFVLGGVAHITREATRPRTELLVAIAGPLCSLVLAAVFGLVWFLVWGRFEETFDSENPIYWLALINLMLALFNLAPGFPLDGGRILRAAVWQRTGDYQKATRIASSMGRGVAVLLIGAGVAIVLVSAFSGGLNPINGIWLAFVGWFLHQAAANGYRQVEMQEALRGLTARSVMQTSYVAVPPDLSLADLVRYYVPGSYSRRFVVAQEGRLVGTVASDAVKSVPRNRWDLTPVSTVMIPADKVISVESGEEALSVLELMNEHDLDEMPVMSDKTVVGMVSRQRLLYLMRLRAESRV
jgi:Zn-dependent protease/CBS domain-containing protein